MTKIKGKNTPANNTVNAFSIFYQNLRGVNTKLTELRLASNALVYDFVVFTETWLSDDVADSELGFCHFNVYRCDRGVGGIGRQRGGGVLVAISSAYNSFKVELLNDVCEHVFVVVSSPTLLGKLIIGSVYIPPKSPLVAYSTFCSSVEGLMVNYPDAHFLVIGDFNIPKWNCSWNSNELPTLPISNIDESARIIMELVNFLNFTQINFIKNSNGRLLDLCFTNIHNAVIIPSEPILPIDKHHPPLECIFELAPQTLSEAFVHITDFKSADYASINAHLSSLNWEFLEKLSIDEAVESFYKVLIELISQYVPHRCRKTGSKQFPRWFSCDLKRLIYGKKKAHKKFKRTRSINDYLMFSEIRKRVRSETVKSHNLYIENVESSITRDPKFFWSYANSARKKYSTPTLVFLNDEQGNNIKESSNLFAKHFSSVYVGGCDPPFSPVSDLNDQTHNSFLNLGHCFIAEDSINSRLKSLDAAKGAGPDTIPPIFLRSCADSISLPLYIIFNRSLTSGYFPRKWKSSFVVPVHKSGSMNDVKNFRPVAIISAIPKLFESLVVDVIKPFFQNIIIPEQHGFMPHRSTMSNLMTFVSYLHDSLENRNQVDAIFSDISKAFDKLPHSHLIHKLKVIGFHGVFLDWIASYLFNRKVTVKLNGTLSDPFHSASGVPQGSHLGPLLFCIFFNDVGLIFSGVKFLIFADDLKIFKKIRSCDDTKILQDNFSKFYDWASRNGLQLNLCKCNVISFHRSKTPILYDYSFNGRLLGRVEVIKDLGVYFDSALTFKHHYNFISASSLKMLGFLCRIVKEFTCLKVIKLLYITLVRSRLEYCSVVWSPFYKSDISQIERIQHKFLRYIAYKKKISTDDIDYTQLMDTLNIKSLASRRDRNDLIILYKIINNYIDSPELLSRINFKVPTRSSRQQNLFKVPYHKSNYCYYSPLSRLQRLANSLYTYNIDFSVPLNRFRSLTDDIP